MELVTGWTVLDASSVVSAVRCLSELTAQDGVSCGSANRLKLKPVLDAGARLSPQRQTQAALRTLQANPLKT